MGSAIRLQHFDHKSRAYATYSASGGPGHASRLAHGELMPIGAYSLMTGLTPKALRIYDRRGLLRPVYVDPDTGYRYYGAAQLKLGEIIKMPEVLLRRPLVGWPFTKRAGRHGCCKLLRSRGRSVKGSDSTLSTR